MLVVLAAALRFPTLDVQSYWLDEAVTASRVIQPSLSETLHTVPASEAAPPLYYGVAWVWSKLFGTGEVGLRSLSALVGTLTVVVAYAAATRLASPRAGLIAAALVATSPLLVWFSQEARAYALVVLLGALSLLFFIRALQEGRDRDYWLWAVFSSLAIATHYFAVFPGLAEAAWLALRGRRRVAIASGLLIALTCAALLPLALDQSDSRVSWIAEIPILDRIRTAARLFIGGPGFRLSFRPGVGPEFLTVLGALVVLSASIFLFGRADPGERRRAALAAGIGGAALGLPLLVATTGSDYFIHRNLIVAWIPLTVAFAVFSAARRAQPAGVLAAGALAALFASLSLGQALDTSRQRDDWREAAKAIGPASAARVIVATPDFNSIPIETYRPWTRRINAPPSPLKEIVMVTVTPEGLWPPPNPPPGYAITARRTIKTNQILTLIWVRPRTTRRLDAEAVEDAAQRMGFGSVSVLIDSPRV